MLHQNPCWPASCPRHHSRWRTWRQHSPQITANTQTQDQQSHARSGTTHSSRKSYIHVYFASPRCVSIYTCTNYIPASRHHLHSASFWSPNRSICSCWLCENTALLHLQATTPKLPSAGRMASFQNWHTEHRNSRNSVMRLRSKQLGSGTIARSWTICVAGSKSSSMWFTLAGSEAMLVSSICRSTIVPAKLASLIDAFVIRL